MNKVVVGRTLIAISLTLSAIGSTIIDNVSGPNAHMLAVHTWPPHALFHDAAFFLLLDSIALIGLWLLFRRSREPSTGAFTATLIIFGYWTPFFYITTLFPQASLAPTSPVGLPYNSSNVGQWDAFTLSQTPIVMGVPLHINALVAAVWIIVASIGYLLFRKGLKEGSFDSRLIV